MLQVNTTGYGSPSISLLTSATGNFSDSIGYYVLTGEYGGFSIAGDYTCTFGHQVYLYVRGGNSGGNGANSSIGLMASLGVCPAAGNFTSTQPFVFVNEVTTVAAAYAMVDVATDPTHASGSGAPVAATGVANAANLVGVATGLANATLPSHPDTKVPQSKINTIANILSACINASGPTSATCTTLFTNARGSGAIKTIPDDTAAAAINIAHNPRANTPVLYGLQPQLELRSSPPWGLPRPISRSVSRARFQTVRSHLCLLTPEIWLDLHAAQTQRSSLHTPGLRSRLITAVYHFVAGEEQRTMWGRVHYAKDP